MSPAGGGLGGGYKIKPFCYKQVATTWLIKRYTTFCYKQVATTWLKKRIQLCTSY